MNILVAPDAREKLDKGYNVILEKKCGDKVVVEVFKTKTTFTKPIVGMTMHHKLFNESFRVSPEIGTKLHVLGKRGVLHTFILNNERKIEEIKPSQPVVNL